MYRILLAEDEVDLLDAMIQTIDWAALGFETPVGCHNGQEAIDRLEAGFRPDLVITDICMPLVDGLALSEYLHDRLPQTMIIILSGYDDFSYAQQAVKLQIRDYVLKPITPKRLIALLQTLASELQQKQSETHSSSRIMVNDFLNRLLEGELTENHIQKYTKKYNLPLDSAHALACVIDVDPLEDDAHTLELLRYSLCNLAAELMEAQPGALTLHDKEGLCVALFFGDESAALTEAAYCHAREVCETAEHFLEVSFSAGVGQSVCTPLLLPRSFRSARCALDERFYSGQRSLHGAESVGNGSASMSDIDYSRIKKDFLAVANTFDRKALLAAIDGYVDTMRAAHLRPENCVRIGNLLVTTLLQFLAELTDRAQWQPMENQWMEHPIEQMHFLTQIHARLRAFCDHVLSQTDAFPRSSAAMLAAKALSYIREHYCDSELSLQRVTDHLAVSVSYFSTVFKSETGVTFLEYLTELRMEKAKQILLHTDRKSYEIAEEIGFSDAHYFSLAFKRFTGTSPRAYRASRPAAEKRDGNARRAGERHEG
jgi:Response regulator containing CheY-like receiver domain and AraC-type DNA-binding domain